MSKKKLATLALLVCFGATAIAGASLAYFTDTAEAENVFTVGNVDVTLIESYVHRAGATAYEAPKAPAVYPTTPEGADGKHSNAQILAASDYRGTYDGVWYSGGEYTEYLEAQQLMPGIHINKMPYVLNEGNSDAYVRIRVMIPKELDAEYLMSSVFCTEATKSGEFTRNPIYKEGEQYVNGSVIGDYAVYEFTRVNPLAPGEMTEWNVWNTIAMDTTVTNDDWADVADKFQGNSFGVLVEVDAIQAASFADAAAAFAAFNAQN